MTDEALLARTFVELADTLVDEFDVVDLLTLLADRCVEVLDVAAAGIMLAGAGGELRVIASSSDAMRLLEVFEVQAQEGPCLDCYSTGEPVLIEVLEANAKRWPRFSAEAIEAGFKSVQALPLRLRKNTIGALNLFHTNESALDQGEVAIAQAFADVATIAILQHRAGLEGQILNEQLQQALNSRVLIEQAKGVTAERTGRDMDESFRALRSHARSNNLRLADVAQGVIDGTIDTSTSSHLSVAMMESDAGITRMTVSGELTGVEGPDLHRAVQRALVLERPRCVQLELSELTFIDSSGLTVLLREREKLADAGVTLVLVKPSRRMMRVLEATNLTEIFDVLESPGD